MSDWKVWTDPEGKDRCACIDCNGKAVAHVFSGDTGERDKNAALIAAAPDLLRFAEAYMGQFCGYQITNTTDAKHDATGWLRDMAKAAITKAMPNAEVRGDRPLYGRASLSTDGLCGSVETKKG